MSSGIWPSMETWKGIFRWRKELGCHCVLGAGGKGPPLCSRTKTVSMGQRLTCMAPSAGGGLGGLTMEGAWQSSKQAGGMGKGKAGGTLTTTPSCDSSPISTGSYRRALNRGRARVSFSTNGSGRQGMKGLTQKGQRV